MQSGLDDGAGAEGLRLGAPAARAAGLRAAGLRAAIFAFPATFLTAFFAAFFLAFFCVLAFFLAMVMPPRRSIPNAS